MSKWITDRPPKLEEATNEGDVWVYDVETDEYLIRNYEDINKGQPWMEIPPPPSYEKPKRYTVKWLADTQCWGVMDSHYVALRLAILDTERDEHREAAERIAAAYEGVVP